MSVSASTRRNVRDPIILNGFVPPKVQRHLDRPGAQLNLSVNNRSGPISLSRTNLISNGPESTAHRVASTLNTPVHFRSWFWGSENLTSLNARTGLQAIRALACVGTHSARVAASATNTRGGCMRGSSLGGEPQLLIHRGGAAGTFTLNTAAVVRAAYRQKPPAMATKNPIAPRSNQ